MSSTAAADGYDLVTDAHLAVMERLLGGHQAGDPGAQARAMDPDVVLVQPSSTPFGGTFHGVEGVAEMMRRLSEHWDRQWNWVVRRPAGDLVVNHEEVLWTARATGRTVLLETVSLYRFRAGRIARIDVFTQDTVPLLGTLTDKSTK
jgi:ketosteroid isomerase-like protein